MSYNGSGTFQINSSGQPVVTGTVISSTAFNALTADLATGLSTAITKDGQTTTTVRVPFAQGISSTLVTDATSATTGSIITAGGISTQKALWVGTTANVAGTTDATSATTGTITTAGGISTQKALWVGTTSTFAGAMTYGGVTLSNSVTGTGSMVLSASPTISGTVTGPDASTWTSAGINFASGKGITFNGAARLGDYEEGTWTPTDASGAGLSLSGAYAGYIKIGNMVWCYGQISYPITASGSSAALGGLPFTVVNATRAYNPGNGVSGNTLVVPLQVFPYANTTTAHVTSGFTAATAATNAQLSNSYFEFSFFYPTA